MNLTDVHNAGPDDLAQLFCECKAVDLSQPTLSRREQEFVGRGSMKIGSLIRKIGYTGCELHLDIADWLLALPLCRHSFVAAYGIHALAEHGTPPRQICDQLVEIARSPLRSDEHPHVTMRALAFRMLVRVDERAAEARVGLEACREYADAVAYWKKDRSPETDPSPEIASGLDREHRWLIARGFDELDDER